MANNVAYYSSLLTSQYQKADKFKAWLEAVAQVFIDIQECAESMDAAFDLDKELTQDSVDDQFDIIGAVVGLPRLLPFQPSNSVSPLMDNESYRIALKARIAVNQWDGKLASLKDTWAELFPGGSIIVIDNMDMTLSVTVIGSFTSIIEDLIAHGYIVPRSQGVLINYTVGGTKPYLGFDRDDTIVAGFDKGHWT